MPIRGQLTREASSYLGGEEQNQGKMSDFLVAGAMATMFFTPVGGKVMSTAFRGIKGGAKFAGKGAWRAGRAAGRALSKVDHMGLAIGTKEFALSTSKNLREVGQIGARAFDFISKYKRVITPAALTAAVVTGAIVGTRETDYVGGPESYVKYEGGMPADNLGATGDLTLALHNNRR